MSGNNQNKTKVSVCCITYNHEKYIAKALEGFLLQDVSFDIEIIIGEDYSTDKTRSICEGYANKYPKLIKLLPSTKNHGSTQNFLRTIEVCEGEYIALCEGDDYWTDRFKLQKQVDFLEQYPEYSIVYHDYSILEKSGIRHFPAAQEKSFNLKHFVSSLPNIQPLTAVYRNIPNMLCEPYSNQYTGANFIFFLLGHHGNYMHLHEDMAIYRLHDKGIYSGLSTLNRKIMGVQNVKTMLDYSVHLSKMPIITILLLTRYFRGITFIMMYKIFHKIKGWIIQSTNI